MTTREAAMLESLEETRDEGGVTVEPTALVDGLETTTSPLGTSQTEPTWVVVVPTGGHPGMPALVP